MKTINYLNNFVRITAFLSVCLTPLWLSVGAAAQAPIPSKVDIAWNRFYDYDELTAQLHQLADAYPELLTLESLGKSTQGRDMWLMTLNNPKTGAADEKPAMYIDGNIHGNEIQASEVVMYSIWYLTKSYGKVEALTELIDRTAFYFIPSVNPDGRAHWFREPNNPHSQRSGQQPTDNDFDGEFDEDGPEDLDGDGYISYMWRQDPNGSHRRDIDDPRIFVRVDEGEKGDWSFSGSEGIDNDGDGDVNEDGRGGYDMNRNWPSGWQPSHIQYGAGEYPFSYPETRAIGMFVLEHPNIASGQSYHNAGGMLLRGPGARFREDLYPRADQRVYDRLGEAGEEIIPHYDYMIIHSDLYTVHGGTVNWLAEGLGICSFTNELWTDRRILQQREGELDNEAEMRWTDRLLFGQTFTEWTEHDHPTYGKVLIGGGNKYSSRNPPSFLLEEECHRNFAFTMFQAGHMPLLKFSWIDVEKLGDGLWQITVEVENEKIIPTRMAIAREKQIGLPDRLSLSGEGVEVLTSGTLRNRHDRTLNPVEHRPQIIFNDAGIPGESQRLYRFVVAGREGAEATLQYSAEKARDIEVKVELREGEAE